MASTTNQIKSGLDGISDVITAQQTRIQRARNEIDTAVSELNALPTRYSTLITDINGLSGTDPFVLLSKDELARMTTDFLALKAEAIALQTAIKLQSIRKVKRWRFQRDGAGTVR